MKTLVLVFITSIILISCGTVGPTSVIECNYDGVYSITHNYGTDSAYTLQGKVNFEFSGDKYTCEGEKYLLPPGRSGIFRLTSKKLKLIDNGRHNAAIDFSLFLNGDFQYSFNGNRMVLEQHTVKYNYYHKIILDKQQKDDN